MLLTAVLAEGVTELRNAATEPEIQDLIAVLQKMGAIISVLDNRVIHITGVESLSGYKHRALPDRLEAASWACAALATGGDILVRGALPGPDDDLPERLPPRSAAPSRSRTSRATAASASGTRAAR